VPASQIEQAAPFAPMYPALHTQALASVLCDGEVDEAGQFSHDTNESLKYSFAAHAVDTHCPAFPAMNPVLHTQALASVLSDGEVDEVGQFSHDTNE
jgi:hypothetical protein